jgi:predicted regulator of Ras-like GTPase activity (Roadblock/LC7/MglB family)
VEGMLLPREPLIRIDSCIERLLHRSRALCVLLADISGQLISERGSKEGLDTVGLAALAASNMAATAEMARQIGETASFPYLFHEGQGRHIYISAVGRTSILIVVFDEMTQIGLVRIFAKLAVRELLQVVPTLEPWLEEVSAVVDREFGDALAEGLDEAFVS